MRSRSKNNPGHVTQGDVLDDLFPADRSPALKLKADLYEIILKQARRHSQKQLQIILGVEQPRVSELLHGKIAHVSIEKLLNYAGKLGIKTRVRFTQPAHTNQAVMA